MTTDKEMTTGKTTKRADINHNRFVSSLKVLFYIYLTHTDKLIIKTRE